MGRWLTQQVEGQINTRLSLSTFQIGLKHAGLQIDSEEVECILANMIFKVSFIIWSVESKADVRERGM